MKECKTVADFLNRIIDNGSNKFSYKYQGETENVILVKRFEARILNTEEEYVIEDELLGSAVVSQVVKKKKTEYGLVAILDGEGDSSSEIIVIAADNLSNPLYHLRMIDKFVILSCLEEANRLFIIQSII